MNDYALETGRCDVCDEALKPVAVIETSDDDQAKVCGDCAQRVLQVLREKGLIS